jgi:hypothetical protein
MGMEEDTREFLLRIVNTLSFVLIWMILNLFLGIYKNMAFFEHRPGWKNYLFYAIFLVSLFFLLKYLKRKWEL